jgi:hypothetical protein
MAGEEEGRMKETPIIMTGESVRGILAGRKTQTRRVMQPLKHPNWTGYMLSNDKTHAIECGPDYPDDKSDEVRNPYIVGDRRWVKETWNAGNAVLPSGAGIMFNQKPREGMEIVYRADPKSETYVPKIPWRSPMFMPRWASRIMLEITEVRVERVQSISEQDAIAEGIKTEAVPYDPDNFHLPGSYGFISGLHPFPKGTLWHSAQKAYQELWEAINATREKGIYAWEKNPWVWAITFQRVV